MIVYILMTIFAVLLSLFANVKKTDQQNKKLSFRNIMWYGAEIILIVVAGVRYNVGQDYLYTYVPYFNNLLYGVVNENIEVGFYLLNKLVQVFTRDYAWLFIVCSVIFFHYIFKTVREQSPMPTMSIFLLVGTTYYFIFLNAMRQMMAIAIFLYAIKFIKERNFKKYLLYIILASLVHKSVLLLLPVYFLYGITLNPIKVIALIGSLFVAKPIIVRFIMKIISFTNYNYYIGSKFDTSESGYVVLAINAVVLLFSMLYMHKFNKDGNIEEQNDYNFYCILQTVSTIVAIYDGAVPLLNRIRWATGLSIIIFIPFVIKREKNYKMRVLYSFLIITLYSAYSLYTIGVKNSNNVLPYMTIFERGK